MNSFPNFTNEYKSLLAKHLSKEIFEQLKDLKTSNDYTLEKAIKSGIENPDSGIGIYAGDAESYKVFNLLFEKIIVDYHKVNVNNKHTSDLDSSKFSGVDLDSEREYILSTRIRVGRNMKNFPLGTIISKEQRNEVENLVSSTLLNFSDDLKGSYYPLYKMDKETENQLIKDHFLFKNGDRFLESAGLNRDWALGRGIFHNNDKTFLVWINEEDQLRIISMQKGGDIKTVFDRLIKGIKKLEEKITFLFDENLGYISSCPTNLGTAMRASVHIKLPKLATQISLLEKITTEYHLQIRGIDGEHSENKNGVIFDISNKRRLGITEIECIEDLYNGVEKLIETEKNI